MNSLNNCSGYLLFDLSQVNTVPLKYNFRSFKKNLNKSLTFIIDDGDKGKKKITIEMLINDTPSKGDSFIGQHDGYRININSSLRGMIVFFFFFKNLLSSRMQLLNKVAP